MVDFYVGVYSVCSNVEWAATSVYGPNQCVDRNVFLRGIELCSGEMASSMGDRRRF